ncbi:MAG TPA: hypothetical protein VGM05_10225 [Planctomycetaceae bacterium]
MAKFAATADGAAVTVLRHLAALGHVRTATERAFTVAQMDKIVANVHVG